MQVNPKLLAIADFVTIALVLVLPVVFLVLGIWSYLQKK